MTSINVDKIAGAGRTFGRRMKRINNDTTDRISGLLGGGIFEEGSEIHLEGFDGEIIPAKISKINKESGDASIGSYIDNKGNRFIFNTSGKVLFRINPDGWITDGVRIDQKIMNFLLISNSERTFYEKVVSDFLNIMIKVDVNFFSEIIDDLTFLLDCITEGRNPDKNLIETIENYFADNDSEFSNSFKFSTTYTDFIDFIYSILYNTIESSSLPGRLEPKIVKYFEFQGSQAMTYGSKPFDVILESNGGSYSIIVRNSEMLKRLKEFYDRIKTPDFGAETTMTKADKTLKTTYEYHLQMLEFGNVFTVIDVELDPSKFRDSSVAVGRIVHKQEIVKLRQRYKSRLSGTGLLPTRF